MQPVHFKCNQTCGQPARHFRHSSCESEKSAQSLRLAAFVLAGAIDYGFPQSGPRIRFLPTARRFPRDFANRLRENC
jgi:hypothetical protein